MGDPTNDTLGETKRDTVVVDSRTQVGEEVVTSTVVGGSITELEIDGTDVQTWSLVVRDTNSQNPRTVKTWRASSVTEGSEASPITDIGASREVVVENETALTSGNVYTINTRVDEFEYES